MVISSKESNGLVINQVKKTSSSCQVTLALYSFIEMPLVRQREKISKDQGLTFPIRGEHSRLTTTYQTLHSVGNS